MKLFVLFRPWMFVFTLGHSNLTLSLVKNDGDWNYIHRTSSTTVESSTSINILSGSLPSSTFSQITFHPVAPGSTTTDGFSTRRLFTAPYTRVCGLGDTVKTEGLGGILPEKPDETSLYIFRPLRLFRSTQVGATVRCFGGV